MRGAQARWPALPGVTLEAGGYVVRCGTYTQVARAPRSLVVKATYETEKTEVDVDQIVKDLQAKVRAVSMLLKERPVLLVCSA